MSNNLGSYPNELILRKLQPAYWFSAHLHVHYAAIVNHGMLKNNVYPLANQVILNGQAPFGREMIVNNPDEIKVDIEANPDEIEISLDDDDIVEEEKQSVEKSSAPVDVQSSPEPKVTKFLSLDKCLPRRQFLQVSHQRCDNLNEINAKAHFVRLSISPHQMMIRVTMIFTTIWSGFLLQELCNPI